MIIRDATRTFSGVADKKMNSSIKTDPEDVIMNSINPYESTSNSLKELSKTNYIVRSQYAS
jgi:hypothetical protein